LLVGLAGSSAYAADEIPYDTSVPESSNESALSGDQKVPSPEPIPTPASPVPLTSQPAGRTEIKKTTLPPPAELSGLGGLAPFSDIAVISKRFLPKTKRFEAFPNFGLILNDAFFNDFMIGGRLAYYLSEKWGIEAIYMTIGSTAKSVTEELTARTVQTDSLATPINYMGLSAKWSPLYGKIGWMNRRIVPFDFYFSLGGGITKTNQGTSPPTLHLGAGQMFAITKWMAARWDLSWFLYQSETNIATGGTPGKLSFNNLYATIGVSFFFPKADYR
jgi:outer membrane beta-barrel protein